MWGLPPMEYKGLAKVVTLEKSAGRVKVSKEIPRELPG